MNAAAVSAMKPSLVSARRQRHATVARAQTTHQQQARRTTDGATSANKNVEKLALGLMAGAGAAAASPIMPAAEATITPSLSNLLYSVVYGGLVLAAIAGAITGVSKFDRIRR
mmetsp:Transcript_11863/g.30300  ORF Transcript_11863/g.30300 Transcript_11863/m.30300 type:complete len:113 (-) Transcript_11863:76-414(-)